ncbi:hypothetical protein PFISCL1PPCAC_29000, partial [Pristionchus fissidentatus]
LLLIFSITLLASGEIHKAEGEKAFNLYRNRVDNIGFLSRSSMAPTVSVAQLRELIKTAGSSLRILDATYRERPAISREEFQAEWYGKMEKAQKEWMSDAYTKEHIPSAAFFNCEAATYPGQYEKSALYPADIFQQYVQLLGVNKGDTVVVYSRGACSGMLWAARAWWLLREYGMERVHVLEGGLDRWKAEGRRGHRHAHSDHDGRLGGCCTALRSLRVLR